MYQCSAEKNQNKFSFKMIIFITLLVLTSFFRFILLIPCTAHCQKFKNLTFLYFQHSSRYPKNSNGSELRGARASVLYKKIDKFDS